MKLTECKTLAEDSVTLFACVLNELDKLADDINSKTRKEVALSLTCAMLGAVR